MGVPAAGLHVEQWNSMRESGQDTRTTVPTEDRAIFDRDAFREFVLGDEDLMEEVSRRYLVEAQRQVQEIETACRDRDAAGIIVPAHSLKGTSGSICAAAMRAAALDVETGARAGRTDDMPRIVANLRERFEELRKILVAAFPPRS